MKKSYFKSIPVLVAAIVCFICGFFTSCEERYELRLPLAVNQTQLKFGAEAGSTHMLVYSTGSWTAELQNPDDASWATIENGSGSGNGDIIFTYAENTEAERSCIIVIKSGNREIEVEVTQAAGTPLAPTAQ